MSTKETERLCKSCGESKPIDSFSTRGKSKSSTCKDCVRKKGNDTREKKKIASEKQALRNTFNNHWKETAANIEALNLIEVSDLLKEYQKQISNLMRNNN
jgi:hypothetical protein